MTTGKLYRGDIYARSLYRLGKICEEKGWKSKAVEHYERFLKLWKDADPGLPEVEDAGKRLAGLKPHALAPPYPISHICLKMRGLGSVFRASPFSPHLIITIL